MSILLPSLLFPLGLVFLVKGADALVFGASSLAKRLHVSNIVIGLTVVAFGTSAPELVVNLFSAIRGTTDIALGNIVGSNIANILLILGIAALLSPLTVQKNTTWKEIPLALLAALLLWVMANDWIVDGIQTMQITRSDGIVLLAFFLIFLYYTFGIARIEGEGEAVRTTSSLRAALFILGGIIVLTLGGKIIIDSAVTLARLFGVSESLIGLTAVAVGTSLPELATSVVAALRRHADIAVGNVVGSNIFNIFFILGITAVFRPLPVFPSLNIDLFVVIIASLLLFIFLFIGQRRILERWQGGAFIAIYGAYIVYLVQRG